MEPEFQELAHEVRLDSVPLMKIVHKKPPILDVEAYVSAVKKSGKRPTIATLLVLYVDDHVAGGLRADALLKDLAKLVTLDPPEPLDKFLGVFIIMLRVTG
eukprot:4541547-Amphidinium_carterae.1